MEHKTSHWDILFPAKMLQRHHPSESATVLWLRPGEASDGSASSSLVLLLLDARRLGLDSQGGLLELLVYSFRRPSPSMSKSISFLWLVHVVVGDGLVWSRRPWLL